MPHSSSVLIWVCALSCLLAIKAQLNGVYDPSVAQKIAAANQDVLSAALHPLINFEPEKLTHATAKLSNADLNVSESFKKDVESSTLRSNVARYDGLDKHRNLVASFSCESFAALSIFSMCSDIVDYPFMVPSGQTLESLETTVRATVPTTAAFLTSSCLSDYKKLRCAEVYKPCVENVVPDDASTYVNGLPYKMPCASLCVATSFAGTSCAGIFEGLGLSFACTDGSQYDTTNTASQCNSFPTAAAQIVADKAEPYIGTACTGMFTTTVMPNTIVVPGIAPLLGPYVGQMVVEGVVNGIIGAVPKYFTESCQVNMRRAYCGTFFNEPQVITSLAGMGFAQVYLPKMPEQSICTDYGAACFGAIAMIPALAMNCSQTVAGLALWPTASQVIVSLPVGAGVSIDLSTDPMSVTPTSDFSLPAQCPHAFQLDTFPDISNDRKLFMVPGVSNCVQSCNVPLGYSPDQAKAWRDSSITGNIMSLVIAIPLMFNLYSQESKTRNWFVTIWLCYVTVLQLSTFIMSVSVGNEPMANRCETEVSYYDTTTIGADGRGFMCAAVGAGIASLAMLLVYVCLCLCTEIWLRVVWRVKEIKFIRRCYAVGFFVVLFQAWANLAIRAATAEEGSSSSFTSPFSKSSYCDMMLTLDPEDPNQASNEVYYPLAAMFFCCVMLMGHMGYVCLSITLNAAKGDDNVALKLWNTYRTLFLYCVIFLFGGSIATDAALSNPMRGELDAKLESFGEYIMCIVLGFTSLENDPTGGTATCGLAPKINSMPQDEFSQIWLLPVVFAMAFMASYNANAGKLYWNYTPEFLKEFLLDHVYAQKVLPVNQEAADKMDQKAIEMASMKKPTGTVAVGDQETKDGSEV